MSIKRTNFGQLKISGAQFADGENQSGRDDQVDGNGNSVTESLAPGEISIKAFHDSSNPTDFDSTNNTTGGINTDQIANLAVSTAKLKDVGGSYGGIETVKFAALAVTTDKIEALGIETAKLETADTTTTMQARITISQTGGSGNIAGSIQIEAGPAYRGMDANQLSINISGALGNRVTFTNGNLLSLRVRDGNDTVQNFIDDISALADFTASAVSLTAGELSTVVDDPANMTVQVVDGFPFADYSGQTPSAVGIGITTDDFNNLAVQTAKIANNAIEEHLINSSAVTTDKIQDWDSNNAGSTGIQTGKFADSAIATAKIVDGDVETDQIETFSGAGTGVQTDDFNSLAAETAKIADSTVVVDDLASLAVTTAKFKSIDTTTVMSCKLEFSQTGGSGNIAGSILIEAGNNFRGHLAYGIGVSVSGALGTNVTFQNDNLVIRINGGDDTPQTILDALNALSDFSATASNLTAGELGTVVDASGSITIVQVNGFPFGDYSVPASPVGVYAGIQGGKYANAAVTNAKLKDNEAITPDKIAGGQTAHGVMQGMGGADPVEISLLSNSRFHHSQSDNQAPANDAAAEIYSNITGVGPMDNNGGNNDRPLNMTSATDSSLHQIKGLEAMPAVSFAAQDLVSKEYVDSVGAGSRWKEPVRVTSNSDFTNVTVDVDGRMELIGGQNGQKGDGRLFIDGVKPVVGDRILFHGFLNSSGDRRGKNGIWQMETEGIGASAFFIISTDGNGTPGLSNNAGGVMSEIISNNSKLRIVDGHASNGVTRDFAFQASNASDNGDRVGNDVKVDVSGVSTMGAFKTRFQEALSASGVFPSGNIGEQIDHTVIAAGSFEYHVFRIIYKQNSTGSDATNSSLRLERNTTNSRFSLALGSADVSDQTKLEQADDPAVNSAKSFSGGVKARFERPEDADRIDLLLGLGVFVLEGDYYSDVAFHCVTPDVEGGFTLNTDALEFSQKTAIGMHSGDGAIEIQPDSKSIRIGSGMASSDLSMTILRKHIRAQYGASDPAIIEMSTQGGTADQAIVIGGDAEFILAPADDHFIPFAKYAYSTNVFQANGDAFLGSVPAGAQIGGLLNSNPSPIEHDDYHQVFLNGVLLKQAANENGMTGGSPSGDYFFIECHNGVALDNANAVDPNTGSSFADHTDEYSTTKIGGSSPTGPLAASQQGAPRLNPLALKIASSMLSPGDVLEVRFIDRYSYATHDPGSGVNVNLGGFDS